MKYFTKEWFHSLQYTNLHLRLKPSGRAAMFSEEYFQELYALHVQERLEQMKRVSEVDVEALAARFRAPDAAPMRLDGKPLTEQEERKFGALNLALAEALLEAPQIQFDPEKEHQFAHNRYLFDLRRFERSLPAEIRDRVADMRVLALRYAAPEVIEAIREYCEANERAVHAAIDAYREELNHNFSDGKPPFYADFDLHDCRVTSMRQDGRDVCMVFEDCACRFRDAEIIRCDAPLEGAYWLYDEIYPLENGGYEIHALLQQLSEDVFPNEQLVEFIVRCCDAEINWPAE